MLTLPRILPSRPTVPVLRRADLIASGVGVAGALVWRSRSGLVLALAVAVTVDLFLRRRAPAITGPARAAAADLPFCADLIAAALRAGATPDHAVGVVAAAIGGPLGDRLGQVADRVRAGEPVEAAWQPLSDIPGGSRMARAAARTADSGAALAAAFTRVADDLRLARTADAEATAVRRAVFVVLPLGLCFLPAFLLSGVAPVIIALLAGLATAGP